MNICLSDVYFFIQHRRFKNGLTIKVDREFIINILGNPLNYIEQRKKNKEIMGYGAINIYLWNGEVVSFSINSVFNYYNNTTIEAIEKEKILQYLENNSIEINDSFILDTISYICFFNIKLGFFQDKFSYLAQGM